VSDPNTGGPGGAPAVANPIFIVGTARVKARAGVTGSTLIALAQEAIAEQLDTVTFPGIPIGGFDQVSGSGVIYKSDLADAIALDGSSGLTIYGVDIADPIAFITVPSPPRAVIPEGSVAVRVVVPGVVNATSSAGLIEITTAAAHGLITNDQVQIYGVLGTVEANGAWLVTFVDGTNFTLQGSAFVNAYISGGQVSRIILTVAP
jgi:hypothetical protein